MANDAAVTIDRLILDVLRHLRAMWRYRWLGLIVVWVVAMIGAAVVFAVPRRYEASARIFVNADSILKPLMTGMAVEPDMGQRVALLSRLLISRPNVERLIQATGLDEKVKTTAQREQLIAETTKVLRFESSGARDNNIYVVRFQDSKPERAKEVVEFLVTLLINSSQGGRASDTEAAKQFLDEQAATYEKKLREAESRLKEFKLRNMVGMESGEGRDYFAQTAAAGQQLNQAQLQLREAENSRDAFRRGLAGEDLASPIAGNTAAGETVADIDARLEATKRNLDGLLQRFTEDHPDVVGARRTIHELEGQRRKLVAEYRKAGIPLTQVVTSGPRASEELKFSLAQADANVASLRARVAEYSARYSQLREMAKRMPEFEAELAQLNRDYEINKKNYESLIARRESANIAGNMQSVEGMGDFRLIDPPQVPSRPVSLSRSVFLLITLVVALAVGAGVMFLAKEVRARFLDSSELHASTGLPVLGVISLVINDQTRLESGKQKKRFVGAAGALLGIYLGVVVAAWWLTSLVA